MNILIDWPAGFCRTPARRTRRAVLASVAVALAATAILVILPSDAFAAAKLVPAVLNDAQRADVARVEAYLNAIRTLRAKFLQVAENGATAEGDLLLSRPGLMRIDYDPPSPHLIVADGAFLIYHEKKLNQTSHIPLSSSLAGFLLRDAIKLAGDVTLTRFEQERGVIRLSLVKTDDAEAGQLTLVLSDGPLQLRQWTVTDGQGGTTRITLINSEFGVALDRALFAFTPPPRDRQDR